MSSIAKPTARPVSTIWNASGCPFAGMMFIPMFFDVFRSVSCLMLVVPAVEILFVVTLVSALIPAWRASRVPPLAALRDVAVDTSARSLVRLVVGLVILAGAVALVIVGAFGSEPPQVGLGVLGVFVGTLLVSPVLARPVASVLGAPIARLRGVSGGLARDNAVRNPRRTASTAFALMIGVGLVSFFLVLNSSVRASIDEALSTGFRGDFIVTTDDFGLVGLPTSVGDDIAALPEVDEVVPFRFAPAFVGPGPDDTSGVTGTKRYRLTCSIWHARIAV